MKFIKVKSIHNQDILINVEHIESIYKDKDKVNIFVNTRNDDNEQNHVDVNYDYERLVTHIENICLGNVSFIDLTK